MNKFFVGAFSLIFQMLKMLVLQNTPVDEMREAEKILDDNYKQVLELAGIRL